MTRWTATLAIALGTLAATGAVVLYFRVSDGDNSCGEFSQASVECAVRADFEEQLAASRARRYPLGNGACPYDIVQDDLGTTRFHDAVRLQAVTVMLRETDAVALTTYRSWAPDPLSPQEFQLESRWYWRDDHWSQTGCRWRAEPFRAARERDMWDGIKPIKITDDD